jgi:hypothetical protein
LRDGTFMTSRFSYDDIRRMARVWFSEARIESDKDAAEVAAWKAQHRKENSYQGGLGCWPDSSAGGCRLDSGDGSCGD